ncbi:hypothetical protein XENOCAPTIV_006061 [Xenoophorus captivus]|uniref:Uncharacterized protein n=1 Tax=Xenoophorus captivus TaxID=1517983 RepID=A0ABV0S8F5_9TELE
MLLLLQQLNLTQNNLEKSNLSFQNVYLVGKNALTKSAIQRVHDKVPKALEQKQAQAVGLGPVVAQHLVLRLFEAFSTSPLHHVINNSGVMNRKSLVPTNAT